MGIRDVDMLLRYHYDVDYTTRTYAAASSLQEIIDFLEQKLHMTSNAWAVVTLQKVHEELVRSV